MTLDYNAYETVYTPSQSRGVVALVVAGFISLLSVLSVGTLLIVKRLRGEHIFPNTHTGTYYASLLVANGLQSVGSIASIKWIMQGAVTEEPLCYMQGGWKNSGNVSTALFSLLIAIHTFNVLFRRSKSCRIIKFAAVTFIWATVMFIVFLGPVVLEKQGAKEGKGPYFGVSGYWCWITDGYPGAQTGAEYMFMFSAAGFSLVIFALVFLRMRGNLIGHGLKTRLHWVRRSSSWKLDLGRDEIDQKMFPVIKCMIWFPVAYTTLIVPIALARFSVWTGHEIPFGVTIFADFIFNLNGTVNAILLLAARAKLPEIMNLPTFEIRRRTLDLTTARGLGVDPFVLPPHVPGEKISTRMNYQTQVSQPPSNGGAALDRVPSNQSTSSLCSVDSITPLIGDTRQNNFSIRKPVPPIEVEEKHDEKE